MSPRLNIGVFVTCRSCGNRSSTGFAMVVVQHIELDPLGVIA